MKWLRRAIMIILKQDREGFVILSDNEGSHTMGDEILRYRSE